MPPSELFSALRWWATLVILGLAVFPLSFVLFRRLADRGYAFVKMLGLLLVAYLFWIAGSLGFLGNNLGGILMAGVAVLAISTAVYSHWQRNRSQLEPSIMSWLRENLRQVLVTELVFLILFLLWVWVRAQNPTITATEKPMEFAFLNAIGRSPSFPPSDPWLSGFAISYYYFGYVMTSLVARLAHVQEAIAFNLAVAWLVAATGTGAFGLVYNLLATRVVRRGAVIFGLVAAIAVPLAGNLEVVLEVAHSKGWGSSAFWQWLDVRDLEPPAVAQEIPRYEGSSWWWWRASRPLHEYHLSGRPENGLEPIAEFPAFSFVLGDLHPHVLALPFAFLSLAAAFVWWLKGIDETSEGPLASWSEARWIGRVRLLGDHIGPAFWLLSALILGGLSFLNTWDVLIHLFIVCAAFFLARWRTAGWRPEILSQTLTVALLLIVPIFLLYLPFYIGFSSQAGAPYLLPMLMRPTRLAQFLIIFGMPLIAIGIFLLVLAARQRFRYWKSGVLAATSLLAILFVLLLLFGIIVAASVELAPRVTTLAQELGVTLAPRPNADLALGWSLSAVIALLPAFLGARLAFPAMSLLLAGIIGLIVMIWRSQFAVQNDIPDENRDDILPFVLLLIGTAALLTLGPEFLYLRDNFGFRLNTIFKFYYQAWVLFGVAALFGLGYLWQERRRPIAVLATAGYGLALVLSLLFPYLAVSSRAVEFRGPQEAAERLSPTLNGLAHVENFNRDEYDAILWLRENVEGIPVIAEAVGGQYSGFGRIAANTGLPTILGWAGHEYQWRGDTPEPALRDSVVRDIYGQTDLTNVVDLLDRYQVQYIVVGGLEREAYGTQGLEKFAGQLEEVFNQNSVVIYRWQPNS